MTLKFTWCVQNQWLVGVVDGVDYDQASSSVILTETKTRSSKSLPRAEQVESNKMQVSAHVTWGVSLSSVLHRVGCMILSTLAVARS